MSWTDLEPADAPAWVLQRYLRDYLACIASVDENVGRLLNHLDDAGLAKNTLVIYTSDQGFLLGEHGLYDKRLMYEPSLRMPLLARWPGVIDSGQVEDRIVLNLDFAPTLLGAAGVKPTERMQGQSMLPLLKGQPIDDWRKAMLYRFYERAYGIGPIEGVRTERHKLVHWLYGDEAWELYDLRKDPEEMNNLYNDPDSERLQSELHETFRQLKMQYQLKD